MKKQDKGITMVALVITIIVLLMLAGISISEFTGHGLFAKAQEAKEQEKISSLDETLRLKLIEYGTNKNYNNINIDGYIDYLKEKELIKDEDIEDTGEENSKYITLENKYIFLIEEETKDIIITYLGTVKKIAPIIKDIKVLSKTTNSIKVEVDSKLSKGATYKYYIKDKETEKFKEKGSSEETVYEYTNLIQSNTYIIKVEVIATNGKKAEKEIEVELGTVPSLTEADIEFTYSPAQGTWTNGSVIATVSTTIEGYTLQTSTDGKSYSNATSQTFITNGTIYARLWDGTNAGGIASGNVTNIDTTKPVVTELTTTTNSITITATDEASGIVGYAVTTSDTEPNDSSYTEVTSTTNLNTTVTGKIQGTTYYVWVKDQAGNVSTRESIETGSVTGLTTANTTFSYNPDQGIWTNGSVIATVSSSLATGEFKIQTSKDAKTWEDTTEQKFTANGPIYARLIDKTGQANGYATGNVTNIDTTKPKIGSLTQNATTATVGTIIATNITDVGSGLKGYYISTDSTTPTETSISWITLSGDNFAYNVNYNGTYYVWVIDNAGNIVGSSIQVTNIDITPPTIPTITYNSGSNECKWENNINITLSSNDSQSSIAYYEIDWDGDGNSNATTGSNFIPWNGYSSCNTRFRAVDAVGNRSGWTGSIHIHMDTERPVHTNWWYGYVDTDKITLYIQVSDNVGIQRVQCATSTEAGGYGNWVWADTVWDSSANAYRIDIYPSTWGHYNTTYLTHLYIYDYAGNGGYYNQASTYIGTPVAAIGSTYYSSVTKAIAAIPSSGTITMVNSTRENVLIPSGKSIVLNLNWKTISADRNVITNNGYLRILNGYVSSCDVNGNVVDHTYGALVNDGGTMQVENVNCSGWTGLYNYGSASKAYIYGGIFTAKYGLSNYYGGYIMSSEATINGSSEALHHVSGDYGNLIIKSRASNYGLIGYVNGKALATSNTSTGQSQETITIYNTGITSLAWPTWTNNNGQDDITWHTTSSSTGTHTYTVKKSDHKNESGEYIIHIYQLENGTCTNFITGIRLTF